MYWLLLFAVVTNNFGKILGITYLFLDPEYLNKVDFWSFFIMGAVIGGFTMAYNITGYIIDGHRCSFLGAMNQPFTKFCINNSIIPIAFLIVYIVAITKFQINNEYNSVGDILEKILGFIAGFMFILLLLFTYFNSTNTNLFKVIASNVDRQLKKVPVTRFNVMQRYYADRKRKIRVESYLDFPFRIKLIGEEQKFYAKYDREAIIKVFDQTHLNSVIIELFIFILILALGIFRELPLFQIPAAASVVLLLTILVIFTGAISFWFIGWSITAVIVFFILLNIFSKTDLFTGKYHAFGLNYNTERAKYSRQSIIFSNNIKNIHEDRLITLEILNNWRKKFPDNRNPKMIFICASGGGLRATTWTMRSLQMAYSISQGKLMKHSILITGASGGLVGASYFRELSLRKLQGESVDPYSQEYLNNISKDNLNSIVFTLLVNDLFVRYGHLEYNGLEYVKGRGYAFEQQLNTNTDYILDKKLSDYKLPEQQGIIPILLMAPTIVNDGRKMYISCQDVSYMNTNSVTKFSGKANSKGVSFRRFFDQQGSADLSFLSALRMSATFPYITPNITLPTNPEIEIMDAGISDNFGIDDAVQFLHTFKDWIAENTSGVIILSIRDSPSKLGVSENPNPAIFQKLFTPITSVYNNWWNIQDLNNQTRIEMIGSWFKGRVIQINLEYDIFNPISPKYENSKAGSRHYERASLNWRLTTREKIVLKTIFIQKPIKWHSVN